MGLEADGGDGRVDEEFERYFEFIVEVGEWRDRIPQDGTLLERAERVFAVGPNAPRNMASCSTRSTHGPPRSTTRVAAHRHRRGIRISLRECCGDGRRDRPTCPPVEEARDVNLFKQCCRLYGLRSGRNRRFTLAQTLMLFAVLVHRQSPKEDVQRRLRVLRNLTDTAGNEVIEARMADLVEGVDRLMSDGTSMKH